MDDPTTPEDIVEEAPAPSDPAKPRTSPWVWVALTTSIIALVLSICSTMFWWYPGFPFGDDFDDDFPGAGYYVDQNSVLRAVEDPCEAMLVAAEKIALGGPAKESAASLHNWATTAQGVVTAINGADPNGDSKAWRDDWKATISAVDTFADNFGKPRNRLRLPDGVEDMYFATDAECGVPVVIAGLDPDHASSLFGP